jgi:uncharacterized protein YbbK (DUF523 family)
MSRNPIHFAHRHDQDGRYHSICPECFVTVAHSRPEAELAELEQAHVCARASILRLSSNDERRDRSNEPSRARLGRFALGVE